MNWNRKVAKKMRNLILSLSVAILFLSIFSAGRVSATNNNYPYAVITLTNSQTSATSAGLQQEITFNPSTFSQYEASDLGNIRFCADSACSTLLYAWLQSCSPSCTPSATSASVWVNIPSSIAANGGTLQIYMVFETSADFDGVYWGEAPQLSSTWGQYDNGANVFTVYNNGGSLFATSSTGTGGSGPSLSTSAPSPFTQAITGSVSGGGSAATTWTTNGETSITLPSSYIAQTDVYITGSTALTDLLTNVQSITNGQFYVFRFDTRSASYDTIGYYGSGATTTTFLQQSSITSSVSTWYQMTAVDNNDQLSLYKSTSFDLGSLGTLEVGPVTGEGYTGGGIAVATDGATSTEYWAQVIVRLYPPNGVMPSVLVGGVQTLLYVYDYAQATGTIDSPSVVLQGGSSGASTISTVAADAAQVTATAGMEFYQTSSNSQAYYLGNTVEGSCTGKCENLATSTGTADTGTSQSLTMSAAPSKDASALGAWSTGTTFTISLTTTHSPDVIIAWITTYKSSASVTVTSLSTTGITWQGSARESITSCSTTHETTQTEWWGVATGTLSGASTTVTLSTTPTAAEGLLFAAYNVNTASPFDPNLASAPVSSVSGCSSTNAAPTATGVTTTNANDLVLNLYAGYTSATETAGSVLGTTGTIDLTHAATDASMADEYRAASATGSGSTCAFGTSTTYWRDTCDALVGVPKYYKVEPDVASSTTTGSESQSSPSGYSWETATAVNGPIVPGTWTFELTTTAGTTTAGTAYVQILVWSCATSSEGSCTFLFSNLDTSQDILGSTTATQRTYTASEPAFSSVNYLAVEYWVILESAATSSAISMTETTVSAASAVLIPTGTFGTSSASSSGSFQLAAGSSATFITPSYTVATSIYAGTWVSNIWLSSSVASKSLSFSVYTVSSSMVTQSTILSSASTNAVGTSMTESNTTFSGSAGSIPASGYIEFVYSNPSGSGTTFTIYWGTGEATDFVSPTTYNYVLAVSNPTTSSYSMSLGVASSSTLTRLSYATISFTNPSSTQIIISGGSIIQSTGSTATLAASSTADIVITVEANALPTTSSSPSLLVISLKLQPSSSLSYSQYTIDITIG